MDRSSAGLHVTMDARVADVKTFKRTALVPMISKLVHALEMQPLGPSHVYEIPTDPAILKRSIETNAFEDEGGITLLQAIGTSHVTIHCWPLQRFFSLDIFSCKSFDVETALAVIRHELGVVTESTVVLHRKKPLPNMTTRAIRTLDGPWDQDGPAIP